MASDDLPMTSSSAASPFLFEFVSLSILDPFSMPTLTVSSVRHLQAGWSKLLTSYLVTFSGARLNMFANNISFPLKYSTTMLKTCNRKTMRCKLFGALYKGYFTLYLIRILSAIYSHSTDYSSYFAIFYRLLVNNLLLNSE